MITKDQISKCGKRKNNIEWSKPVFQFYRTGNVVEYKEQSKPCAQYHYILDVREVNMFKDTNLKVVSIQSTLPVFDALVQDHSQYLTRPYP